MGDSVIFYGKSREITSELAFKEFMYMMKYDVDCIIRKEQICFADDYEECYVIPVHRSDEKGNINVYLEYQEYESEWHGMKYKSPFSVEAVYDCSELVLNMAYAFLQRHSEGLIGFESNDTLFTKQDIDRIKNEPFREDWYYTIRTDFPYDEMKFL